MNGPIVSRAIAVLVLIAAACAGGEVDAGATPVDSGPATSSATTRIPQTSATTTSTQTAPESSLEDTAAYLVEMAQLRRDYLDAAAGFGSEYTSTHPQPTSEMEQVEFMSGYLLGWIDIAVDQARMLTPIEPPAQLEPIHRAYVDNFAQLYGEMREYVAELTTVAELEAFWISLTDPTKTLPSPLDRYDQTFAAACADMARAGADAGHSLDLGCPESALAIHVEIDAEWRVTPDPLPPGDGWAEITIANEGGNVVRPVILDVFSGDPLNLPLDEGLVDLTRSGVIEPSAGFASFGLAYPSDLFGDDSNLQGEPPELAPGDSITVRLLLDYPIVVFDYRAGEFEAGSLIVIERP